MALLEQKGHGIWCGQLPTGVWRWFLFLPASYSTLEKTHKLCICVSALGSIPPAWQSWGRPDDSAPIAVILNAALQYAGLSLSQEAEKKMKIKSLLLKY